MGLILIQQPSDTAMAAMDQKNQKTYDAARQYITEDKLGPGVVVHKNANMDIAYIQDLLDEAVDTYRADPSSRQFAINVPYQIKDFYDITMRFSETDLKIEDPTVAVYNYGLTFSGLTVTFAAKHNPNYYTILKRRAPENAVGWVRLTYPFAEVRLATGKIELKNQPRTREEFLEKGYLFTVDAADNFYPDLWSDSGISVLIRNSRLYYSTEMGASFTIPSNAQIQSVSCATC